MRGKIIKKLRNNQTSLEKIKASVNYYSHGKESTLDMRKAATMNDPTP